MCVCVCVCVSLCVCMKTASKPLIQEHTCISMLIASLYATAKIWKQPKCPSTDKWIKTI